jgi:GTP-binding protein
MSTPLQNVYFQNAYFLLGAARLEQLPADQGSEVAFAGRSNAGKSSALNALCGRRALSRVSRTPGRTQEMNVFGLPPDAQCRLIDLPGSGYAKVPPNLRERWAERLEQYLRQRASLRGVILIMDIRHPLTPVDRALLDQVIRAGRAAHLVLTKADKIARGEAQRQLYATVRTLEEAGISASLQLFSAQTRAGVEDLESLLREWLWEDPNCLDPAPTGEGETSTPTHCAPLHSVQAPESDSQHPHTKPRP